MARVAKKKTAVKRRKSKREPLVLAHLERVSRKLLKTHLEILKEHIGRRTGIYALYSKDKLYYVGLASFLIGRLYAHTRNRHAKKMGQFFSLFNCS
jgi:hypothetical protein